MTDTSTPSPEHIGADGDPGDETADRYRFQWTWAAIMCCALLDEKSDIQEVFCEHHEDVLLKHSDGMFSGQQVKTRRDDQPPWKALDEAVLTSCARFVGLESSFPNKFRTYSFLTNHPLHSSKTGTSLPFVLGSIAAATSVRDLSNPVHSFVKRVAQRADVNEAMAFAALSKTKGNAELPKLRDTVMRLMDTVAQCWTPARECTHDSIRKAALALIEECGRASSLAHYQALPAYIIALSNDDEALTATINAKRVALDRIQTILENGRDNTATLAGSPLLFVDPGEGSTELLRKKLDAGGFSFVSRNSAEDLRDKADYLAIGWIKKFGSEGGRARYDHIRSLVLNDAGRAFDATKPDADGFGPAMREYLVNRFRQRRANGDQLYDCAEDHLEGIAFSLTSQCKVVWSIDRPWEVD